jgi:steroid 5-alpha reductase family enzyme
MIPALNTTDFGEMTLWLGFFVIAASSLAGVQLICAAISPVFVCTLLIKISGIPLLEIAAGKKWGDDASYKRYKHGTPVLVPLVGRAGDAPW